MKMNKSSLFWKIFLSFWLANILVLLSATYFTLKSSENRERRIHKQVLANQLGERLIPILQSRSASQPFKHKRFKKMARKPVRIIDDKGRVLLDTFKSNKSNHNKPGSRDRYTYVAEDARQYIIEFPSNRVQSLISEHLHKMLVLRLVLILFFSGLVSYFLTRFITQPLKLLGRNSRDLLVMDDDLPEVKKLNERRDEIGDLSRDIASMQLNLTQLINDKQNLLHDVSHELKAPLSRLMAASALLELKCPDETSLLQRLNQECENMADLIDSMMHLSRLNETGIVLESIDLLHVLTQCQQDCQFEFPEMQIQLKGACDIYWLSDSRLLSLAVMNILRNACLHSGSKVPLHITLMSSESDVCIQIVDGGKGLTEQQLAMLFLPFQRDENSQGFGLGMSIAKRAIEKINGSLLAENREEGGLMLEIRLSI